MTTYRITGGAPVSGTLDILGAKNFATKAMVAALLAETPTILSNVPRIGDVEVTRTMIESIGATIEWTGPSTLRIDPRGITTSDVVEPDAGANRISILMLPALLHRCGRASVPAPGGCAIGARPVDFHIMAARQFGATVTDAPGRYVAERSGSLVATHVALPYPSVGATETAIFLGVRAQGTSVISNVAIEPEIIELVAMMNTMGARVRLLPSRELVIEGVSSLSGTRYHVLGDRIEAASWAALAAATDGRITVRGIAPGVISNFVAAFTKVGGGIAVEEDDAITFFRARELSPSVIETDVYPGFSTDWQQPFAILLSQAEGVSVIHETVYERRFGYLSALAALGAKTQLSTHCLGSVACRFKEKDYPHSAIIIGKTPLVSRDASLAVPDLRAGLAYLIAAAVAEGTTTLTGAERIVRGYGELKEKLSGTNLSIESIADPVLS